MLWGLQSLLSGTRLKLCHSVREVSPTKYLPLRNNSPEILAIMATVTSESAPIEQVLTVQRLVIPSKRAQIWMCCSFVTGPYPVVRAQIWVCLICIISSCSSGGVQMCQKNVNNPNHHYLLKKVSQYTPNLYFNTPSSNLYCSAFGATELS